MITSATVVDECVTNAVQVSFVGHGSGPTDRAPSSHSCRRPFGRSWALAGTARSQMQGATGGQRCARTAASAVVPSTRRAVTSRATTSTTHSLSGKK